VAAKLTGDFLNNRTDGLKIFSPYNQPVCKGGVSEADGGFSENQTNNPFSVYGEGTQG
jgi:hypothetical protein